MGELICLPAAPKTMLMMLKLPDTNSTGLDDTRIIQILVFPQPIY